MPLLSPLPIVTDTHIHSMYQFLKEPLVLMAGLYRSTLFLFYTSTMHVISLCVPTCRILLLLYTKGHPFIYKRSPFCIQEVTLSYTKGHPFIYKRSPFCIQEVTLSYTRGHPFIYKRSPFHIQEVILSYTRGHPFVYKRSPFRIQEVTLSYTRGHPFIYKRSPFHICSNFVLYFILYYRLYSILKTKVLSLNVSLLLLFSFIHYNICSLSFLSYQLVYQMWRM